MTDLAPLAARLVERLIRAPDDKPLPLCERVGDHWTALLLLPRSQPYRRLWTVSGLPWRPSALDVTEWGWLAPRELETWVLAALEAGSPLVEVP